MMTDEMQKAFEEEYDFQQGAVWLKQDRIYDFRKLLCEYFFRSAWQKCGETLAAEAEYYFDESKIADKFWKDNEGAVRTDLVTFLQFYTSGARYGIRETAAPLLAKIEMLEKKLEEQCRINGHWTRDGVEAFIRTAHER